MHLKQASLLSKEWGSPHLFGRRKGNSVLLKKINMNRKQLVKKLDKYRGHQKLGK
jgi:hypothetical protein